MSIRFRRSFSSLWNIWLCLGMALVCFVVPGKVTYLLDLYVPLGESFFTVEKLVRLAGMAGAATAGAWLLYKRYYSRYIVHDDRIEAKYGILKRHTSTANFQHIRSIDVEKTLMGMILGYGTLLFGTAGTGETNVVFEGIADPEKVKEKIRRKERGESWDEEEIADAPAMQEAVEPVELAASQPQEEPTVSQSNAAHEAPRKAPIDDLPNAMNTHVQRRSPTDDTPESLPYRPEELNALLDRRFETISTSKSASMDDLSTPRTDGGVTSSDSGASSSSDFSSSSSASSDSGGC